MEYLVGNKVKLSRFSSRNITPEYMAWINSTDINRYVDMGRIPIIKDEVIVPDINETIMFAMMAGEQFSYFVGTATIHNIDWISRKAEIGYMVGKKEYWGQGIATDTVSLLVNYAFNRLGLSKLNACALKANVASIKVLEKNGFVCFGADPMDYYIDGDWIDNMMYVKLRKDNEDK